MSASLDIQTVESAGRSSWLAKSIKINRYFYFQVGMSVHRPADELTNK